MAAVIHPALSRRRMSQWKRCYIISSHKKAQRAAVLPILTMLLRLASQTVSSALYRHSRSGDGRPASSFAIYSIPPSPATLRNLSLCAGDLSVQASIRRQPADHLKTRARPLALAELKLTLVVRA
jgi:hypothetical protein